MEKRVLIYFSAFNDHFAGIVDGYNGEKMEGSYYHVIFDDGDEADYTWREVLLGIQWHECGGFIPTEHDEELPSGSIGNAGGAEWEIAGCGYQFQGETNYGQVARGAVGVSKVRQHSIIDVANYGKNVSDPAGGQFQARLNESVSENHTIFPGTRNVVLYMAQRHPRPAAGAAQLKPATWSPVTKIYAYNSEKTLSKATERFKPYPDSKNYHPRHGMK